MRNLITFILVSIMVLLSSQTTTRYYPTIYFPYEDHPLMVSVRDTDNIEVSNIWFDMNTKKLRIQGNLELGLTKLCETYDQILVPAQQMNYAASKVRQYLNANGTVKRRDSLTWAIKYYDSIKLHYGILDF